MTAANILFVVVGAIALLVGLGMVVTGIRAGVDQRPRNNILLIAGMMLLAFGLILGGFAIAYTTAGPLDLNAGTAL
ncbi:MAG: hypothetical protein ABR588_03965 [Sphingomicrobium sp.]|nr:hypothetical protein [Sphingomonadales bacterium]